MQFKKKKLNIFLNKLFNSENPSQDATKGVVEHIYIIFFWDD
jgi:hypothetical protein